MSDTRFYEVEKEGYGEYEEKKSRFLAVLSYAANEEEAAAFIAAKKKAHHDARHNCSAYIVTGEDGRIVTRFSDDGEPSKTAGQPILDVMTHANLVNAVCVVTRYFGGILLGMGGLVRAYTESAKAAVSSASLRPRRKGFPLAITTDYNGLGKVEYLLRERDIAVANAVYEDRVRLSCEVPSEEKEALEQKLVEQTNGKAGLVWGEERFISSGRNTFKN